MLLQDEFIKSVNEMKWLRLCSLGYRREIYKSLIVAVIDNFLRSNDDEYCIGFWINSLKQLYPKTYEEYYDLQRY